MIPLELALQSVGSARGGVLLDTNVLLLLLVGRTDPDLINRCGRVRGYSADDYETLCELLRSARSLAVTPHILAETWNLGENALNGKHRDGFRDAFLEYVKVSREAWVNAAMLVAQRYFYSLGITDSAIVRIKRRRPVVVTDDGPLARQLETLRLPVVNFTHLRNFG